MVEEWRQSRKLVISFVGIVCGGCWKTPYPSADRFGAMSRCYPYPPPGYEKKAQAELILSPKKEKHKHKDKKKKKRRDCDANGVSHDKDKRSKKVQRTELVKEVVTVENRKIQEIRAVCPTFKMGNPLQRTLSKGAGNSRSEQLPESASCDKAREANGRADGQLSLIVDRHAGNGNASVAGDLSPPTSHALGNGIDLSRQRHAQSMPQTLEVWSAVDDQEWLFLHNNQLHLKPREKTGESGTSHVLAEALLLPSVDIYALPYVVPY